METPSGTLRLLRPRDIPDEIAQQIALIGMFPLNRQPPNGEVILIGKQPFVVTGEATAEEFLAAIDALGLATSYRAPPPEFHIVRVTTD